MYLLKKNQVNLKQVSILDRKYFFMIFFAFYVIIVGSF